MRSAGACIALVLACLSNITASAQQLPFQPYNPQNAQEVARHVAGLRQQWAALVAKGEAPSVVTEPSITSGKILTAIVNVAKAPGVAVVQLKVDAGTVGIDSIEVGTNAPGSTTYFGNAGEAYFPPFPPQPQTSTQLLQLGFLSGGKSGNLYTAPGTWRIYLVTVRSKDGSSISYQGSQLAALFPSLTYTVVNHGTPDTTPPTVSSAAILTPTIHLSAKSPYFVARVDATDDLSGFSQIILFYSNPSGQIVYPYAQSNFNYPFKSSRALVSADISQQSPGTYTLYSLSVCDVAGNCFNKYLPADLKALFGTVTFRIEK